MKRKPTYEELERKVKELEKQIGCGNENINVAGINIEWRTDQGICTFENLPVAMMWIDTTLSGLMSGVQAMVGTQRFGLALQSEGRKSVEEDWQVISQFSDFREGFKDIANIASVAGWGKWELVSLDENEKKCTFRIRNSWEGRYQKALGVDWGSGMLAGKMAGYSSKLFKTNCWAEQTKFISKGDEFDEFEVEPSNRSIENEVEGLLLTDAATKADMAVALQKLQKEISERMQMGEALLQSEERYRSLVENTIYGFFIHEIPSGRFLFLNQRACELYGYTMREGLELTVWNVLSSEDHEHIKNRIQERAKGKKLGPDIQTYTAVRKDGSTFRLEVSSSLIIFQDRPAVQGIFRDVTEQERLKHQLQQAQKMEAIGTLAGGIAHDFNNILGIILGNTELAMDDVRDWNPAWYNLEEIKSASLRAKSVVRQLMSFARKTTLEKKPTNIIPIVRESLKLLRSSIPTSIEFRQNIPQKVHTIQADPAQINQILINLCTNAYHAMPDGGILEVSLKHLTFDENTPNQYPDQYPGLIPGRYVNLTISDTGHGISDEEIERIFDPYFTTKEIGKGIGMGLAVVHGIIKEHNGFITVKSEIGNGTTFNIFFPAVEKEAIAETKTYEKLPGGNESILFIDDEKPLAQLGYQRLKRLGYKVEASTNPLDALELFRSQPDKFDLVITDMTMPQMTGEKLIKEILSVRSDIPIILCTGFSEKIDEEKAAAIGAVEYIEKPVDKHDFALKVRRVLDGKKG
jgi:PAS domain S-box-containing protein